MNNDLMKAAAMAAAMGMMRPTSELGAKCPAPNKVKKDRSKAKAARKQNVKRRKE